MLTYISLVISLIIKNSISVGQCGPENYIPEVSGDCIPFSNSTHACCLLSMEKSPVDYRVCFSMDLTDVTPIISIGKQIYRIDCVGLPNYVSLFPLEGHYKSCGVQNPSILSDCWSHSSETERCCMVGNTQNLLSNENPMCYYFPPNDFLIENFTITSQYGNQMFVGCEASRINLAMLSVISLICLLII